MFAEKEYPLRATTFTAMLKSRLRVYVDYEKVMIFENSSEL